MTISSPSLIEIREHCARMSQLLYKIDWIWPTSLPIQHKPEEKLSWSLSSEWLYMAASVENVIIDTSRFDDSTLMCRPAWEYQSKRSELLSQLATKLTMFNFVWGAFETAIKIINPPKVPKTIKSGASIIDDALYFLKTNYEPAKSVDFYDWTVAELHDLIKQIPYYKPLMKELRLQQAIGITGVGVHVVRKMRNMFAHGTMTMPEPEEWNLHKPLDHELIHQATRVILLTLQMILLTSLKNQVIQVELLEDDDGFPYEEDIQIVLRSLHVNRPVPPDDQLSLSLCPSK